LREANEKLTRENKKIRINHVAKQKELITKIKSLKKILKEKDEKMIE